MARRVQLTTQVALLVLMLASTANLHAEQLTFTTGDWRPYIFEADGTVESPKPGFSIEIVNAVFSLMGFDITYNTLPFLRQIQETKIGRYAALAGVYKEEAPSLVFPSEPIGMTQNCFYVDSKSTWRYNGLESLKSTSIAIIGGYSYGKIDRYINANLTQFIRLTGGESGMMDRLAKLVEVGRAAAFIQDIAVARHHFESTGTQGRFKMAGCLEKIALMVGFSPADPRSRDFVRDFDVTVSQLRRSGRLREILGKYGVDDWH